MFEALRGKRPLIMGILNVTPDSFSDGGMFYDSAKAVQRAQLMVEEGADIIDVGGESTRPGSDPVEVEEQLARVLPVIETLDCQLSPRCMISVDTTRAEVAEAALKAGADLINDISAGTDDPRMFETVAKWGVPMVLMHMKGTPKTMQDSPSYVDVVGEVILFLEGQAAKARQAGIAQENVIIDPGIGFGKRREDNLRLMASLERFVETGYPVLLGTSRKRFMGAICGETRPTELLGATIATTALGVAKGVKVFRVHDVRANRQAADVIAAIIAAGEG
jgi:dihydropteroate synthase